MRKIKAKKDFVNKMLAKRNDGENMIRESGDIKKPQEKAAEDVQEEGGENMPKIKNTENQTQETGKENLTTADSAENQTQENAGEKPPKKKWKFGIYQICMLVGIALMVFSAYKLISIFSDYQKSNALYSNIGNHFTVKAPELDYSSEGVPEELEWYEQISVNLKGLKEQNKDVVGWIYFETMDISYPVLYSGDNETYLRTSMDRKYATAGSIFMEGKNHPDFEDSHTIIYGHNMRNLSMFGTLKYFKQDGYYDDHSYFQIFAEGKVYRYQIFAYADIPADSDVYTVPYAASKGFQSFINGLYKTSYKDTGVTATKDDKIITLSTCSTSDDIRFVVHAVRVDEQEVNTDGTNAEE